MEHNHIQMWENCLAIFHDNLPKEQFEAWFKPVASISFVDGNLNIRVPSQFFVEDRKSVV